MKFLTDTVDWSQIKAIGLDLDGTLYDEYEFIHDTYKQVVCIFSKEEKVQTKMLDFMLGRWLEKGSSYPYIFDECLNLFECAESEKTEYISLALGIFRDAKPRIQLNPRMEYLLKLWVKQHFVFLFTDGREILQGRKIQALGIERFLEVENIFISGVYGKGFEKPNIAILDKLPLKENGFQAHEVIYIGDRQRDKDFAANAGFQFCFVQDLFKKID